MTRGWISLRASVLVVFLAACEGDPAPAPETPAPSSAPAIPAAVPARAAHWPTYHGEPSLAGAVDLHLPDALAPLWRYQAQGQVFNTPVATGEFVGFADSKGVVQVLRRDGTQVWKKEMTEPGYGGGAPIQALFDAPLAVFEDTLVAGSASGYLSAWNIATGEARWTTFLDKPILGSPNFATIEGAARVFVIDQGEGALLGIDLATGKEMWSGPSIARCDGSPAASRDYVVYGSCDSAVHVFSPKDGSRLRDIVLEEESQVAGGVVLLGDAIYTSSRSGMFVHANAATGEVVWVNHDCEGEATTTPAVSAKHIVFGANDAHLYALARDTGKLLWKRKLGDTPSSPVIAGDKVLVGADGALHLLRLNDGEVLWRAPVSDEITAPCIAGNLIIIGGDDGTVTAFAAQPGA